MTQPSDNVSPSIYLFRGIGYCLLVLALFDLVHIFIPLQLTNAAWEVQTIGRLVERVPIALLGLVFVFYGEEKFRSKWEQILLKFLTWISLLAGVLFLSLIPLLVVDNARLNNQINYQINTQVNQQVSQIEQLEQQLNRATTTKEIDNIITRFKVQGVPQNIKESKQLKNVLVSEVGKAKKTIRPKTEAAWAGRRFDLLKNSIKWLLGSVVSGFAFIYIWAVARWAR